MQTWTGFDSNRLEILLGAISKHQGIRKPSQNGRPLAQRLKGMVRGIGLTTRDFSIISNNCFAGWIYQGYNLPYLSPTVGLFIMADDFLALLSDLERHVLSTPAFIAPDESRYRDHLAQTCSPFGRYPIGLLNDEVEVHFLHYGSQSEATANWCRRAARINWDRLIVKFNDQNLCTDAHIQRFCQLPFERKICFTARPFPDCEAVYFLREDAGQPCVVSEKQVYRRYIPVKRYLNSLSS
ncbi:MAG: DUF1919 domain-containing protein [Thiohalocapsa sp.]